MKQKQAHTTGTTPREHDIYTYKLLPAGSVRPAGWMKVQLHRDLTQGYIGHYDKVHHSVNYDVFNRQERKSKRRFSLRKEWWSGEHEGYWKDAVVRMAFLTGDEAYMEQAKEWIGRLLAHAGEKGYIGIYADCDSLGCRFRHKRGNGELWTTSRILMAMLAYYEFTQNKQVLEAAEKAAQQIMEAYWDENYFKVNSKGGGVSHGVGFFENLEWLYRLTGKNDYLEFARRLYAHFNEGNVRDNEMKTETLLNDQVLFENHGAHIAEGLSVPQFIASIQPGPPYTEAARKVMEKLVQHFTPGGAMRCDEWVKGRKGTADERYEYCGITEMVGPMNKMTALTGDLCYADRIETMTFNAGQGARFPVLRALSYLTTDNRIKINHREIARRESYDAAHFAAACCALNGARLMPYYVEGMWMKTADENGILAVLYGPSVLTTQLGGTRVQITEDTNYPFSDSIQFTVNPEKSKHFALILRRPQGCLHVQYNVPEGAKVEEKADRLVITHNWQQGDKVDIRFDFQVQQIPQPASKTVPGGGVYLQRGPLVYALPFGHHTETVKEHRKSGFHRHKTTPTNTTGWDWKLDLHGPTDFQAAPTEELLTPWEAPPVKLHVQLQDKHGEKHTAALVPMGTTVFRRVTFPTVQPNK